MASLRKPRERGLSQVTTRNMFLASSEGISRSTKTLSHVASKRASSQSSSTDSPDSRTRCPVRLAQVPGPEALTPSPNFLVRRSTLTNRDRSTRRYNPRPCPASRAATSWFHIIARPTPENTAAARPTTNVNVITGRMYWSPTSQIALTRGEGK